MSSAATGPPYRGLSRVKVTGRVVGTGSPTTTTSSASASASSACSSRVRPRYSTDALSAPSSRDGATAGEHDRGEGHVWQSRTVASLRVALVQHASGLEPDGQPRACSTELAPRDADLVVFPEAFARDFGEAGSDVSAYAEPLDGPFATEVGRVADERGATVVAGMFEPGDDAEPAVQHPGRARRRRGVVPQDPPLRLLRLPRVRPALRRAARRRSSVDLAGLRRSG